MTEQGKSPIVSVRLIIKNSEGKVLILQRPENSHGEGGWCLPGGKVDFGDTVEETVAKELREETTLECTSARFLFYQDSLPNEESEMHIVNLYFECEARGSVQLNEESAASAWIDANRFQDFRFVFKNDEGLSRYWT